MSKAGKLFHNDHLLSIQMMIEEQYVLLLNQNNEDSVYKTLDHACAGQLSQLLTIDSEHPKLKMCIIRTINGNLTVISHSSLTKTSDSSTAELLKSLKKMEVKNIAFSKKNIGENESQSILKLLEKETMIEKIWGGI